MWWLVVKETNGAQGLYTPCGEWRRRRRHSICQSVQIDRRGTIVQTEKAADGSEAPARDAGEDDGEEYPAELLVPTMAGGLHTQAVHLHRTFRTGLVAPRTQTRLDAISRSQGSGATRLLALGPNGAVDPHPVIVAQCNWLHPLSTCLWIETYKFTPSGLPRGHASIHSGHESGGGSVR